MAQWSGDRVRVWTHSQGVYLLRADLALVFKLPVENITVEHMEGAGCYGHNAADDVALDAVLLAKAAGGRPVRVQWSRADEMSHAPFGAAMTIEIEADLDAKGEIVDWRHSIWGNGHTARPGRADMPALLAATELTKPFPRAIATNPSLILADEPTGNLDSKSSVDVMSAFVSLHAQGRTVVMITHEEDIAAYATRVVRLRDGVITHDDHQTPAHPHESHLAHAHQAEGSRTLAGQL